MERVCRFAPMTPKELLRLILPKSHDFQDAFLSRQKLDSGLARISPPGMPRKRKPQHRLDPGDVDHFGLIFGGTRRVDRMSDDKANQSPHLIHLDGWDKV